jgi:hypothetical protein
MTERETIDGARRRARALFKEAAGRPGDVLAIGLEGELARSRHARKGGAHVPR